MKLFKKLILSLCALMLLGMLASCGGGGAGGGDNSSSASYYLSYDGTIFMTIDQEDYEDFSSSFSNATYASQSGNTIFLTEQGFNLYLGLVGNPDYLVVMSTEDGPVSLPVTQTAFDAFNLTSSDYTSKADGKLIIPTEQGLAKMFGQGSI